MLQKPLRESIVQCAQYSISVQTDSLEGERVVGALPWAT